MPLHGGVIRSAATGDRASHRARVSPNVTFRFVLGSLDGPASLLTGRAVRSGQSFRRVPHNGRDVIPLVLNLVKVVMASSGTTCPHAVSASVTGSPVGWSVLSGMTGEEQACSASTYPMTSVAGVIANRQDR